MSATNVIAAAAAFMFPVALSLAQGLHVCFLPFVITLAKHASGTAEVCYWAGVNWSQSA